MNPTEAERVGVTAAPPLGRRELLTRTVPACAVACLGLGRVAKLAAVEAPCAAQDVHKFDVRKPVQLSSRDRVRMQYRSFMRFVQTIRSEFGEARATELLNAYSADYGRAIGAQQAQRSPDTTFRTFTANFRPPNYADSLTLEIVEDTDRAFGLRVTECVWASVFREVNLDGDIGHAAVCNMDYYWPPAFNPKFSMERTKTLMQGDDQCNHRYLSGS